MVRSPVALYQGTSAGCAGCVRALQWTAWLLAYLQLRSCFFANAADSKLLPLCAVLLWLAHARSVTSFAAVLVLVVCYKVNVNASEVGYTFNPFCHGTGNYLMQMQMPKWSRLPCLPCLPGASDPVSSVALSPAEFRECVAILLSDLVQGSAVFSWKAKILHFPAKNCASLQGLFVAIKNPPSERTCSESLREMSQAKKKMQRRRSEDRSGRRLKVET